MICLDLTVSPEMTVLPETQEKTARQELLRHHR